ncbi:MAG TPA: SH3 domain-containing protein, partial [Rhizomicrobium sp.]
MALLLLCLSGSAAASPPADAPHYASVRRSEAYLREGPSYAHRILWIYRRRNYPVRIVGSYDAWRHVKDVDGATGWMHHTQLSEKRSVVFIGFTKSALRADGGPNGKIVAYAARG